MADYIPGSDAEFDDFAVNKFGPAVTGNPTAYGLKAADANALTAALTAWTDAYGTFSSLEAAFHGAKITKDAARAALEGLMRADTAKAQADPLVTPALKESAGMTVPKTTRTPIPVPGTPPSLDRVDTSTRSILRLFIVDSATPDSKAKPYGVTGCEIREQIGGPAPVDPNAMSFLAIETRFPYRADFEATDVGKVVYFALRWHNSKGEFGPWSQVYNAVIPS